MKQSNTSPSEGNAASVLVLVTYYLSTMQQVVDLVASFESAVGIAHDRVIIVGNGPSLVAPQGESRFSLIPGDNGAWEFSGMAAGLAEASRLKPGFCTVLNDSFGRNWEISGASRPFIRRMYQWAANGGIAGWQDIFSWHQKPRFSRRPNSRILVCSGQLLQSVHDSIAGAIERCSAMPDGQAHFTTDEQAALDRWAAKNAGRWAAADVALRQRRIYIEHHLYDAVPAPRLRLFPHALMAGIGYSIFRRIFTERR